MSGNNTNIPIQAGQTFTGIKQLTTGFSNILVSVRVDRLSELTIQQSASGTHWDLHEKWTCDPIKSPTGFVCQTPVALPYFRVLLENLALTDMVSLRLVSILNTVSNVHLDVRQDNTLVSGEDALGEKHTLLTDASGALQVVASLSPVDNQDVTVTARSGTGFLSYLTDNVAVATMPAITGTVAVSSMPHLSYLTDNVAVATQPALAFAVDKVDATGSAVSVSNFPATQPISGSVSVSNLPATQPISGSVSVSNFPATQPVSGTVAVSSQPPLSYLTDNVAVATLPPITGTVAVSSAPHLSYLTDNVAVATQPALAFSTDKVDATGSSVSVTGSVAVTNADITSIKTNTARFGLAIGSNYAETIIQTYTNLSITGGYLYNLNVYSDGSSGTNFLKVYGVAGATIADTPLLIVPVLHGESVNLALSGLKALTGISVRATANYSPSDNNAPSNGISCNLTFSPLV